MVRNRKKGIVVLQIIVCAVFSSAFFWQCANISSPQGGPKDTLPPLIMEARPAFNTVNFDEKKIFIRFNEFIQLKDQQKEVFSSPLMKKNPRLTVRGKELIIEIQDTLLENTTYAINFGSAIRDNNEGNPLNGFRYVFSTGPEIDSMYISGYTADAYKKDSVSRTLIFLYDASLEFDPEKDSTLFNERPRAVGRAENNGIFIARNLKPTDYRIYAFEDNNGNFTYDPGTERVGFLNGTYNPLELPDFDVWFDTTRSYMTADPQVYVRMFMERQFKRQNLAEKKRTSQHRIELYFNAPYPQIDSLSFEGIEPQQIITEYVTRGRDTINLWLHVPSDMLPDTIKGSITYHRHDSINQLVPYTEKLSLLWKYIETREERRERERLEKEREKALADSVEFVEPVKPNPFSYRLNTGNELNPEHNVVFDFDYPVVAVDSAQISLIRLGEDDKMFRVRYELARDTANMRRWIISAPWAEEQKYNLEIPAGVFENVAGQRNDTIRSEFTILSPDKFGTLMLNITGKTPESKYILQLLDQNNKILQEKISAITGTYYFRFISPGELRLRVIEDSNNNGRWDGGNLIMRVDPERVEIFYPESGSELIDMKAGWTLEYDIDMDELFKPIDIMDIRDKIRRGEELRYRRWLEQKEKKRLEEQQRQDNRQNTGTGVGGFRQGGAQGM